MTVKKSERLIVKFITNQANQEEIETLTKWLEDEENQIVFKDFVKINFAIDAVTNIFDSTEVKKQLSERINAENNVFVKKRFSSYYKYAAILVMLLGSIYFYQTSSLFYSKTNVVIPNKDEIVLQIGDESGQIINPEDSQDVTDKSGKVIGKQAKDILVYSDAFSNEKLVYNTLKIPYGKTFKVALSDGTIVHLNSGTSLRYPAHFLKNQNRQVFLTGEAYFEVAKDKMHPFIVNARDINVEVLGTKFDVSTYEEDPTTNVVLAEGKVSLYKDQKTDKNQVYLTPGLKGSNKKGQDLITTEKVNVSNYTAWINGTLVFKQLSFDAIMKKLERNYNVVFINKNKTLGKEIFNATFEKESIENVMKYLSESYDIDYKIKGNKIIIE